jgi:flagellar hook assembly protein FlgD
LRCNIKKAIFAVLLLLVATSRAWAHGVSDSLIVNLKSGQRVAIPLTSIQKITFDSVTSDVVYGQAGSTAPRGLQVSPSFPNPSRTGTNIEFSIATAGSVDISIYDSKGNLVRLISLPNCAAGQNQITWDGLDDRGAPVPCGAYFYEVRFGNETQTKQMVVIK